MLTRQEKNFLWALSVVILTGSGINYALKKLPSLEYRLISTDSVGAPARIDINSATLEELLMIPYVGPKRAQSILDYRRTEGFFKSVEELRGICGIGSKTYLRMAPFIKAVQPRGS